MKTLLGTALLLAWAAASAQTTINIPADQPTIQAGIDAAVDGDTVLVASGTYFENIDFHGKLIKVTSSDGPKATIIDGGQIAPVATFSSGEGRNAILMGFTLTHGFAPSAGGGISISGSSPSIVNNTITQNSACSQGGGIFAIASAPLIVGNVISRNFQQGCTGGQGGGIMVENGAAGLQIIGNRILSNIWGEGAGMEIRAFGNTLIESNIILSNIARGESPSRGGGMVLQVNSLNVLAVENVFAANQADQGAGIYWKIASGTTPAMLNNTA
ncbi:MAG: right-handed parallel beta-helix repeat-containing protein, partial [bacterium]